MKWNKEEKSWESFTWPEIIERIRAMYGKKALVDSNSIAPGEDEDEEIKISGE